MSQYAALAAHYDILTRDVPYVRFADYYEALFALNGVNVRTILDLACGTGTLTRLLANRGYDMIGADISPEMLAVADQKAASMKNRPMFINQPMQRLDLYGTVDAAVCSLDGMNHLKPRLIGEVFERILLFLEPGGLFIFDILTPEALKRCDGEIFLDETDDVYCVWRADFDKTQNACTFAMDIFTREGRHWARGREEHTEYAYAPAELERMLISEGFIDVKLYGELTLEAPRGGERRVFITARKQKCENG